MCSMVLCALTKTFLHFSVLVTVSDTVSKKNYPGMMKVTCVTCAEKMRINNSCECCFFGNSGKVINTGLPYLCN